MRLAAFSLEALERSSQPCFGAQPWERIPLTITIRSVGFNLDKRWRFNPRRKSMASKRFCVTADGYPKFENWCTREDRDTVYFYTHIFPPCRDVAHPTARFRGPPGWCTHIFFLTWTPYRAFSGSSSVVAPKQLNESSNHERPPFPLSTSVKHGG